MMWLRTHFGASNFHKGPTTSELLLRSQAALNRQQIGCDPDMRYRGRVVTSVRIRAVVETLCCS